MRQINYMFFIFFTITFFGCKTSEQIEKYDFMTVLIKFNENHKDTIKFNLCDEIKEQWDRIIILPPYTSESIIEKQKLSNWGNFKDEYSSLSPNDGIVTLLFLNDKKIMRYSIVPRSNIDVFDFKRDGDFFPVIHKTDCNNIKLKRYKDVPMLSF